MKVALFSLALAGCVETIPPPHRLGRPERSDAHLAVSWIGHATMLVQIDDRFVLTDPVLVDTVGAGASRRKVGVPIDPRDLPPLDAVLISHMHFDHLSLDSLAKIEHRVRRAYMPEGGLVYLSDMPFDAVDVRRWETMDDRGMQITAVPVKHVGGRYQLDTWMHAFTGWVVRYHGVTVYVAGDTAYAREDFRAARDRIGHIDLALLPIAPIHPRSIMESVHMDPDDAIAAFADLGADRMIPMHFDTFVDSTDKPHEARDRLATLVAEKKLGDRVRILEIGQQTVVLPK
ncbi:MAG TPA: MBL fold metallo-hydrolase [Polyangiaceae bacterium]|jgi:L-ascorbate metabolism protein UlaG (beta-lactamase superfamily)